MAAGGWPEPEEVVRTVQARNALFRAWRGLGVPVAPDPMASGFWEIGGSWRHLALALVCERCQFSQGNILTTGSEPLEEAMRGREARVLASFLGEGCPHLAKMCGSVPAEVLALYELELLAGG